MTSLCKTHVPKYIEEAIEPVKDNDEEVKKVGVQVCIDMCRKLLENGVVGLHFYTLNLEKSVVKTLKGLNIITKESLCRTLPWANVRVCCVAHTSLYNTQYRVQREIAERRLYVLSSG